LIPGSILGWSLPRKEVITAASKANPHVKRNPISNAWIMMPGSFGFPRLRKVVKIAPVRPIPSTMPTLRARAKIPEAIPWRLRGASPISELLFGDTNSPIPSPQVARPSTMMPRCVCELELPRKNNPAAKINMPKVVGRRDPTRSERLPLKGAVSAMTIG